MIEHAMLYAQCLQASVAWYAHVNLTEPAILKRIEFSAQRWYAQALDIAPQMEYVHGEWRTAPKEES